MEAAVDDLAVALAVEGFAVGAAVPVLEAFFRVEVADDAGLEGGAAADVLEVAGVDLTVPEPNLPESMIYAGAREDAYGGEGEKACVSTARILGVARGVGWGDVMRRGRVTHLLHERGGGSACGLAGRSLDGDGRLRGDLPRRRRRRTRGRSGLLYALLFILERAISNGFGLVLRFRGDLFVCHAIFGWFVVLDVWSRFRLG